MTSFPDRYYKDGHFVIGGSDLGTILGVNPYETPTQLWERMRGLVPAKEETDAMKLGKVLEPWLRWQWEKRRFKDWDGLPSQIIISEPEQADYGDFPWIRCSLDGSVWGNKVTAGYSKRLAIWEGKTTRSWAEWGPFGSDRIPERHLCQVQLYMHCTQLPEAWVSCALVTEGFDYQGSIHVRGARDGNYFADFAMTYGEWLVPYDRELCESMLVKAKAFVDLVEAGIRPEEVAA